jgi:putative chitinase
LLFYADVGLLEGLKADSVKLYAEEEKKRIKQGDQGPSLLPSFANASVSNASTWLNADILRAITPDADTQIVVALTTVGNYLLTGFEINKNNKRLSMFLGQIAHETDGFRIIVQNANYSEQELVKNFPQEFDEQTAKTYANKPEQILNRVYAKRYLGNGPESSGDGWRFRGRGFIFITGRSNYEEMTKATGINLIQNPDLAADPNVALLIAAAFWSKKNLNTLADEGRSDQITRRINGGLNGLESGNKYAELALNALQK